MSILTAPGVKVLSGKINTVIRQIANNALAGGIGITADLPGPLNGYIRLYDTIQFLPNVAAAPLANVSISIQAGNNQILGPSNAISTVSAQGGIVPIGFGEVYRFTNGGATSGQIYGTYYDILATNITLIRQALGIVPVTIIPTPAAGYYNKFLIRDFFTGQFEQNISRIWLFNRDTVFHTISSFIGGTLLTRNNALAASAGTQVTSPAPYINVLPTNGPLTASTFAAVTTTAPLFLGAYETLQL